MQRCLTDLISKRAMDGCAILNQEIILVLKHDAERPVLCTNIWDDDRRRNYRKNQHGEGHGEEAILDELEEEQATQVNETQVSKSVEDFKKLHQTANQTSAPSAQSLQIFQKFNTGIYSVVEQLKAILSNQNLITQNTTSNANLDTKHDNDMI
ncbi:unnamed protein product [Brachionus calyciflorus]|uniref:Uncharacterized protein n=1 Tax=Brachionus calyciflorus TaxID=104777 RepID=A0A814DKR8_9BILA|nr:unnamed protein product [Brachionus calyciflorus]